MNEQVRNFIPHMKLGGNYTFKHKRKGEFVGLYRGVHATKEGDPQDELWIDVDIYTEDGSGQERLSNAYDHDTYGRKTHPVFSRKMIRPSLLEYISSPSVVEHELFLEKIQKHVDLNDTYPTHDTSVLPIAVDQPPPVVIIKHDYRALVVGGVLSIGSIVSVILYHIL